MILNPFTPPAELRPLLHPAIVAACEEVDSLRARLDEARTRANTYADRAENPERHHLAAVRVAVASGGSAADVPDQRAEWVTLHRQAQEDKVALQPLLDRAWMDLREALLAHGPDSLPAVEAVVEAEAATYRAHLDAATETEARHRAALTLRRWVASAHHENGPDPFKPEREQEVTAGKLTAPPSAALALLRADAATLDRLRKQEADAAARREREARIEAERKANADARARQEQAAAEARAKHRAAELERERAKTAAREGLSIPGVTVA